MKSANINKVLKDLLKNHKLNAQNTRNSLYKTPDDYEKSFDKILKFRGEFSPDDIKKIDVVIYHDENNDGMGSAAIAWKYLSSDNSKNVKYIPLKPGKIVNTNLIKDKNVILLDIDIDKSKKMINTLEKDSSSVVIIDDHGSLKSTKKLRVFAGESSNKKMEHQHNTWKFFSTKESSLFVQYIDNQDAKLYMPFTPFSQLVSEAIGYRLVHDKLNIKIDKQIQRIY